MKSIELNKIREYDYNGVNDDKIVLSMDLIYPERLSSEVTFYFNGKQIYFTSFGGGARYTGHYHHPIFIFDTNKSRKDSSKFEIKTCCLIQENRPEQQTSNDN